MKNVNLDGGRTKVVDLLKQGQPGNTVTVKGWVRTKRGNKNVVFLAINDGSSINNIHKPFKYNLDTKFVRAYEVICLQYYANYNIIICRMSSYKL